VLTGVAGAALLLVVILGALTVSSWFKKVEKEPVRDIAARSIYGDHAFAFISDSAPSSHLNDDHAFTVKPPVGWGKGTRPASPTAPLRPTRSIAMEDLLAQLRRAIPHSLRTAQVIKPAAPIVPDIAPPTPKTQIKRPPPPPPRFVIYQGIIRSAEGKEMALVTIENSADGSRKASYVSPGTRMADGSLRIMAFDRKGIRCRTAAGAILTIPYGGKQQIR
jgi:hypothetical protein